MPEEVLSFATFQRTHTQELGYETRDWLNDTSRALAEEYERLREEAQMQADDGTIVSQVDSNELFLKAGEKYNKKGRVFGMGASASQLKTSKRPSSRSSTGVSEDELVRMRNVAAALQVELQQEREERQRERQREQEERQQERQREQEERERIKADQQTMSKAFKKFMKKMEKKKQKRQKRKMKKKKEAVTEDYSSTSTSSSSSPSPPSSPSQVPTL